MTAANTQDYHPEWVETGFLFQDIGAIGRLFNKEAVVARVRARHAQRAGEAARRRPRAFVVLGSSTTSVTAPASSARWWC